MTKLSPRPGIVVGVDGSPGSKVAVEWAARNAAMRRVPLTLVHVLPAAPGKWLTSSVSPTRRRERGQRALGEACTLAGRYGPTEIRCEMPAALTVSALAELSRDAALIAVGCLGTGTLRGRHLGSVSSGLVHRARCPVAVLHQDALLRADAERAPVLVGVDGSPESEAAIAIAFDEASRRGVGLTALHAWSDVSILVPIVSFPGRGWQHLRAAEDTMMAESLAGWGERYPDVTVNRVVVRDDPARQLVETSASAQLVVVGNRGGGGFAGMLLGSVSAAVMLLTHVPVIVTGHPR